jgi:signal transduction histidine kinase
MIAHDLRTPLSAIEQATTLLLHGGRVGDAESALLLRIARNAHRIGVLADELVDLARIRQTGGVPVQRRPIDLRDVVERAVRDVQDAFPGRVVAVAAAGPCPGEWDPARLEQVVANLVQNALQHSPAAAAISVAIDCADAAVARLHVHNAAGAIPPELLPRIFEPFEAGPRSRGAGLGLFIVREIVRAHGGEVRVRSAEPEGSTFTVELPRAVQHT